MKKLGISFFAAILIHVLIIGRCNLQVQKPAISISNQEISITLESMFPAGEGSLPERVEGAEESEAGQVEIVEGILVEQEDMPVPLPYRKESEEVLEIKEINTPEIVEVHQDLEQTTTLESVTGNEPDPEIEVVERRTLDQENNVDVDDTRSEDNEEKIPFTSSVIEAVPLYKVNPPPQYPRRARRRGYEGVVILNVHVDILGRTNEIILLSSSGHGLLDRAAEKAVWQWVFEPARRGKKKIDMWVQVPVRFQLADNNGK